MRNINNTDYLIGAGIIALAFAIQPFAFFFSQRYIVPAVLPQPGQVAAVDVEGIELAKEEIRNVRGNKDSSLYLIEFIDYECYYCNQFHNTILSVFNKNSDKLAIVHKHFPLSSIHPHAINAGIASECVAKFANNNSFWTYTDTLILNNKSFSNNYFKQEALKLGVKATDYDVCIKDNNISDMIDSDQALGMTFGVQGTPFTLLVRNEDGKFTVLESINGAQPESVVEALIDKYLK